MRIYGLKNCDSCRKALKSSPGAQLIDLRDEPLSPDLMARALALFGPDLVNRRSTTWRGLGADERTKPVEDLLAAHPALMKRPLIEADGALYLGWSEATRRALGIG